MLAVPLQGFVEEIISTTFLTEVQIFAPKCFSPLTFFGCSLSFVVTFDRAGLELHISHCWLYLPPVSTQLTCLLSSLPSPRPLARLPPLPPPPLPPAAAASLALLPSLPGDL